MPELPETLRRWLAGPPAPLPAALDAACEWWAGVPRRGRTLARTALVVAVLAGLQLRVAAIDARWGGAPVPVWVAGRDLPVGAPLDGVARRTLPPAAVPPRAAIDLPPNARLALALPEGAVLTAGHLDARGPAAGLAPGLRAVPLPVEEGWGVTPGALVDVWVLGAGEEPAALVARARPVLEVRGAGASRTALVGLASDEVAATTAGLALGRILLAHAPPTAPGHAARPASPAG